MSDRKQTPDVLADLLGGEVNREAAFDSVVPAPKPGVRASKRAAAAEVKPARTARRQPAAGAACWEHRVSSFQQHKGWRLRYVDGVLVKDWTASPLMHEYIAALSTEGWQVAGVCSGEALFGLLDKYQVFFKRPC